MANHRLPSPNDERYKNTEAKYKFNGLEDLGPLAAYRYGKEYELYCVPSRANDETGKDRLFVYNSFGSGELIICDRDNGQGYYLCVGELYNRMTKEEKEEFVANFDEFRKITGI